MINQLELEERVLGAAIANYTSVAAKAVSMLRHSDMSTAGTRWLLGAIQGMAAKAIPVDLMTVEGERKRGEMEGILPEVCNFGWLIEISKNSTQANIEWAANAIIESASVSRFLLAVDSARVELSLSGDVVGASKAFREALDALAVGRGKKRPKSIHELAGEYIEHRAAVYEGRVEGGMHLTVDGMSHAFGQIGLTDFIVIAGRPGSGKTELAVAVANNLAIEQGKAVLYKSLEMEGLEVAERVLLDLAGLPVDAVHSKIFEGVESGRLGHAISRTEGKRFYVDDASGCNIDTLVMDAKEFCAEHANVGALIVDYVGLMEIGGRQQRHDLAIGEITRKLKLTAKELRIPVIGLFQLSRDVEKRAGSKKPVAADLRDSGSIEQDADKIIIVHRDCISNPNTPMQNVAELLNVKRRRGQPTNGYMRFINGHFVGIPDEEQGKWRNIAEAKPEVESGKQGFRYSSSE